jgi:hypothetical protein
MRRTDIQAPSAQVRLRAHRPAPARIELAYRPLPGRLARTVASLLVFWGAIPLLLWVPPHYPWVVGAFAAGLFLAHREWTGRYRVSAFAAICPRCAHPLSLGPDHAISFPHTLTCYHCHFEPLLEVTFAEASVPQRLEHRTAECVGRWGVRWLADEPYVICELCLAGRPADPRARAAADAENERASLLEQLTREGRPLI